MATHEIGVPFGCNVCISPVIRNIDAQPGLGSEAELLAFQSPEKIRKVGALAHGGVQPLQIFIRRFRQRDTLGASGVGQDNLISLNRFDLIGKTRNRTPPKESSRRLRGRKNVEAYLILSV